MQPEIKTRTVWRRDVLAWCCYDWANSCYTTLVITVFAVYIQQVVFSTAESGTTGAIVWAWSVSISMLIGALLSPLLGAVADASNNKRLGLALSAIAGSIFCMLMALVSPTSSWTVIVLFVLVNICFELSLTFYNGFLPEIASDEEINRVSSAGMAWGYLGGGIGLLIALLFLNNVQTAVSSSYEFALRICVFGTGVWWLIFTLPTIFLLRDKPVSPKQHGIQSTLRNSLGDIRDTIVQLKKLPTLALFLLAFLFFNDGVQTVISQSPTFAMQELKFTAKELIAVILMVQFVAIPGEVLLGRMADLVGQKRTLMVCLLVWIALLATAWFIQSKTAYWIMAFVLALVLGGTQAVSRAMMGVITPQRHAAKYFGFFNLSGKATSFLGTFLFGLVITMTGSSRLAVVNLLVFFVIGLAIVALINMNRGVQERDHFDAGTP